MLSSQRHAVANILFNALRQAVHALGRPSDVFDLATVAASIEKPKQAAHGDIASNIALRLARVLGLPPAQLGQALSAALLDDPDSRSFFENIEVAGPGFINFTFKPGVRAQVVSEIASSPGAFGLLPAASDATEVLIEFVSANPTGPLHVGHGRQAALGDSLAALLQATGHRVRREFYYNDAGAQIQNLAVSVQARAKGLGPEDADFPTDGYRGDYIADIAKAYLAKETTKSLDSEPVTALGDPEDLEAIRRFAVSYLRHEQDLDLRAFGVMFDRYYLESSLYTDGRVEDTVARLVQSGHAFEQDGALWLRTTDFGDDKDRVMRKSDGGYTYFVPDIAYHVTKWQRGFKKAINIQGSDHHGTIARVRAGLQALDIGIPKDYPDYILHKMVTVMRGGQEVKISKRAGSYVTLRDLITWSGELDDATGQIIAVDEQRGRDAVRFFLVSRKADSEFVFDVDLALSKSDENPVYYIQYAHARVCSVLAQAGLSEESLFAALDSQAPEAPQAREHLAQLTSPRECQLLNRLADFPDALQNAAQELSPHLVAFYLRDLAADLHGCYNSDRVLVDDPALRSARLSLMAVTGQVLRQGLGLLGVSAPVRM
jgi:arginyl-tRNA synthetase